MFKKPLSNIKTSAPLRNTDRKKLKQGAATAFSLTPEEAELLVPIGIQSLKFSTHLNEHGVAYLDSKGNPLWITLGKGSDDLVPTIYTLWKKQDLVPSISTPTAVIPVLIGGADLMIPGVIQCPPSLTEKQLVSVRQFSRTDGGPVLSPPLAIGRLALSSEQLISAEEEKGKAVFVIHTWKDYLWEMGSKGDPPPDTLSVPKEGGNHEVDSESDEAEAEGPATTPPLSDGASPAVPPDTEARSVTYTPQEVSDLLLKSLVQTISKVLQSLPPSTYPIPATIFYSNYILPNRPAFPTLVLLPEGFSDHSDASSRTIPRVDTEITIKASSHKSLTTFLKFAEKSGLLTLKPPQKQQPDILITTVNPSHPLVVEHSPFVTIKEVETTAAKKAAREEKEKEAQGGTEVEAKELWKPHQTTVDLFEAMSASPSAFYSSNQVRELLQEYVTSQNLINPSEPAYVNLDVTLLSCLASKDTPSSKGKNKDKPKEDQPSAEFLHRNDLVKKILNRMQSWYEVKVPGKDVVTKKGALLPIQVMMKTRQGRKSCTLITGFEPFLVIDASEMAEELRRICAGSTSVSPVPGKPAGSGMEVFVQGKQKKAVVDFLVAKGIPKQWIAVSEKK